MAPNPRIQRLLESAYTEFHSHYHRERDPVSLVHAFSHSKDREAAAFLTALLSYGNVTSILTSVNRLLLRLGPSPYQTLVDGKTDAIFASFQHRFTKGVDMEMVAEWIGGALRSHGSLEAFFVDYQTTSGASLPMRDKLSQFVQRLAGQPLSAKLQNQINQRTRNLKYLLSDPLRGSACKRLNMFLRWMVRDEDGIDLGLWRKLKAHELMLPVDTHLLKTLRLLRWTTANQANWQVVEKATHKLRIYAPLDPIRYDFALCHLSMEGKSITNFEVVNAPVAR